ncbi:MAG TPA: polyprenyl synthetase family protein [Phycisphaerae bacterium]|nr:polyprenyl synthetase family protein [Phycisphaerae bacterium]
MYEPVAGDLEKACRIFDDELFSDLPAVNELCSYIRQYRGKMMRPALLLLSARTCGRVTEEHHTLAAVVELVHMATLVHDDVLDEADVRRRCPTVCRRAGNEAAVLLGDYLISHAFHLCSALDSQYASRLIGQTTNTVCEGELQQVHHRGDYDLNQTQYIEIITRKTASLTGACCRLGAHYAGAGDEAAGLLERYGLNVGIAFQITDDVLDIVGNEEQAGKTLGRDLEKRKLTLPLIHCFSQGSADARKKLRNLLDADRQDRPAMRNLLGRTGSIAFATQTARSYISSAVDLLEALPASEARDSLHRLAAMIIDRQQ